MQKRAVFYVYVIFWEQSGQAGVENGAMLTAYLFRYTPECTISSSNFQNFLRLRWQGGIDPLTKILRTFLFNVKTKVKYTDIAVRSLTCHTATGTHVPHGITRCYLPPGWGDIPTLTPAEANTCLIKQPRRDARLSWPSWFVTYWDGIPARRRSPIQVLTGPDEG